MAGETNVNITPGSGTGIDTFNVGSGTVGSGSEAIRQAIVPADPRFQSNTQSIDDSGAAAVRDETLLAILGELRAIRIGISILADEDLKGERDV